MNRLAAIVVATALLSGRAWANDPSAPDDTWKLESKRDNMDLFSRVRPGSSFKEFKAVTIFDATPGTVHNVLDDIDSYPQFMPYTTEARLVRREDATTTIVYQRLSPKLCSDRDYTLRVRKTSFPGADGLVYFDQWGIASEPDLPPKANVQRVKICEGSWRLEPAGPNKTKATYCIYTDSGGSLPAFIANTAGGMGIRRLFAALRKQVTLPKYSATN